MGDPGDRTGSILGLLIREGLVEGGRAPQIEPIAGGISSYVWKVTCGDTSFCVKQARPQLDVNEEWRVPVERNRFEVLWYQLVETLDPDIVPRVLAHDDEEMLFVMEYFPPDRYRTWMESLRDGDGTSAQARSIGERLSTIHASTAGDPSVAATFSRTDIFHAIRLEPYLEATAILHPDLAERLLYLSNRTAKTCVALIHGDVSPKNILVDGDRLVFIDAECACFGDPAFDLAFCLKHLLLKCLWRPQFIPDYRACYAALVSGYMANVSWESQSRFEARVATLLPGLFLARVDGRSPVEYVVDEEDREKVRRCAREFLGNPCDELHRVLDAWMEIADDE